LASRKKLAPSTKAQYREWLAVHVLPILGHLSIAELKPRLLQEWQDTRLEEGAGPAVLGKAQTLLGQILKKAVLPYEYLDANPVAALDKPEYAAREHRWITASEVEAIRLWYLERDDIGSATLVSVLAYVGPRPQAHLARLWTDLRPEPPKWVRSPAAGSGGLQISSKNSQGVILPGSKTSAQDRSFVYVPSLVVADYKLWQEASLGTGLIFPRAKDGEPWTKTDWDNWRSRLLKDGSLGYSFKQAARDVGLGRSLKPYDLRHTCATLCAAAGWNDVELGQQLQNSAETCARVYKHLLHEAPTGGTIDDYIAEARGLAPVRNSFGAEVV
jgi:integrase